MRHRSVCGLNVPVSPYKLWADQEVNGFLRDLLLDLDLNLESHCIEGCLALGGTQGQPHRHIVSQEVSVPNGSQGTSGKHMEGCAALLRNAAPRYYWPTAKPVMQEAVGRQEDVLGVPSDHVDHECVPAFICEEHSAPVVNLLILLFSAKCQTPCVVLSWKHDPQQWMSGSHTILVESVSDRFKRHMHICGLLEIILKALVVLLLLILELLILCCWVVTLVQPPDVLACFLVAPPWTQQNFWRQLTLMCLPGWATLCQPLVWVVDSVSCYQYSKVTKTSVRKHWNLEVICGHQLAKLSTCCLFHLHNRMWNWLSMNGASLADRFTEVRLTWSYIVLFKHSLCFVLICFFCFVLFSSNVYRSHYLCV